MPLVVLIAYVSNSGSKKHSCTPDSVPTRSQWFSETYATVFESKVDRIAAQKFDGQSDSDLGIVIHCSADYFGQYFQAEQAGCSDSEFTPHRDTCGAALI